MQEHYKQIDQFIVTPQLIGKGCFGYVYRGFQKNDYSFIVAVKVIPLEVIGTDNTQLDLLRREIQIMQKIKHTNIVRMYGANRTARNLYMFLEYCKDGDLNGLLQKRGSQLSERESIEIFQQITDGFKALYENNIIHRDIKPANILIHEGHVKITDFGFARVINCGMDEQEDLSKVGTPLYMSPQILNETKFSSKCDVWSTGMMFYQMIYGHTPWSGQTPYELYNNIKKKILEFPANVQRSKHVIELIKQMLIIEDSDRISWKQIFVNPVVYQDLEVLKNSIAELNAVGDIQSQVDLQELYLEKSLVINLRNTLNENIKVFLGNKYQDYPIVDDFFTFDSKDQLDFESIVKMQDQYQVQKQVIIEIDSYFIFQRNLSVFISQVSCTLYKYYKQNEDKYQESKDVFYKSFVLLQLNGLTCLSKLINILQNDEINPFGMNDWPIYQNSQIYQKTMKQMQNDHQFFKDTFDSMKNKLKSIEFTDNSIFNLLNNQVDDEQFMQEYDQCLGQMLQLLKSIVDNKSAEQLEMKDVNILKYIFYSIKTQKKFKWNQNVQNCFNFNEFYEQQNLTNVQEMQQHVNKIIASN